MTPKMTTEIAVPKKRGRPMMVITKEKMHQVEKLAAVLTTEQIADFLGIARRTFYDEMNRNPELAAHYKSGKSKAIASVGGHLLAKAQKGDLTAMIFYLKTRAGWRETKEDIPLPDNHFSITITDATRPPDLVIHQD